MTIDPQAPCTAFVGHRLIASGPAAAVVRAAKQAFDADRNAAPTLFDDATGETIEVNLLGSEMEVLARLAPAPSPPDPRRAGRPRLGVVAREVTLLPRHWDWLAEQPEGASAALRKLVEEARRDLSGRDRARRSKAAADRFLRRMAGDLPLFEDAYRAFYAGDHLRMQQLMAAWPADVQAHVLRLAERAKQDEEAWRGGSQA